MTSFASLMALSATNTKQSQLAVESALQERQRKEALQRKQQAEREAKEREQEKKLRLKRFEDEKREQQRLERLEAEKEARALALQRREEEQRNNLLYGPKKAAKMSAAANGGSPKYPSSSSGTRDVVRKSRLPDSDDEISGPALTREEIRERKLQAGLRKTFTATKRAATSGSSGHTKFGKRLPGGALNIETPEEPQYDTSPSGQSVKDRLQMIPSTLTLLQKDKRDKRTIDEIQFDVRQKRSGVVLDGEKATSFNNWFPDKKKEQVAAASPAVSGTDSPVPRTGASASASASTSQKQTIGVTKPMKAASAPPLVASKSSAAPRGYTSDKHVPSSSTRGKLPTVHKSSTSYAATSSAKQRPTSSSAYKPKRPRSPSLSESPPAQKKRKAKDDISTQIWEILGKKRSNYVGIDVFSDDEDMEVNADVLEQEERQRSANPSSFVRLSIWHAKLCLYRQCSACETRGNASPGGRTPSRGRETSSQEREGTSSCSWLLSASIAVSPYRLRYWNSLTNLNWISTISSYLVGHAPLAVYKLHSGFDID
ncbi:hypothetical protein B0H34DRAFT_730474 [Crassisporium funariophilum]|nr:hypothetical protein B0H34DRAFT_730474 [Crassisporium funariophilum]